jgi:hypothetical protein
MDSRYIWTYPAMFELFNGLLTQSHLSERGLLYDAY